MQVKALFEFVLLFFIPHHELILVNVFPFWQVKFSNHRIVTTTIQNRKQHSNWLSQLSLSLFLLEWSFSQLVCTKQASKKRQSALTETVQCVWQLGLLSCALLVFEWLKLLSALWKPNRRSKSPGWIHFG